MRNDHPLLATLAVAAVGLATALAVLAPAHRLMGRRANESVFLKNYRKLFWEESLLFHKMEYVLGSSEANDVVFLGDSTCLLDLDPLRLQEKTGLAAYNLGTLGWLGLEGHLAILRSYLQHHPKPRLLVYLIWPGELTADASSNEGILDRFIWAYSPELRLKRGLTRWPIDVRLREEVRTLVGVLLERRTRYLERPVAYGITHERLGRMLAESRGFFGKSVTLPVETYAGDVRVAPLQRERLEELLRFAESQGLRVLVRLAPMPPGLPEESKRAFAEGLARLKLGPRTKLSLPVVLEFPTSEFNDSRHLNAAGVRRLTDIVAQESRHE